MTKGTKTLVARDCSHTGGLLQSLGVTNEDDKRGTNKLSKRMSSGFCEEDSRVPKLEEFVDQRE
jgi:hypothetical protein